mgnify:CR=1 FL=1
MIPLIHTFDADGYYMGSSEMPPGAAGVNPEVATLDDLPPFNPETHRARYVSGAWVVEVIPVPEPQPEPEPLPPQYPRYVGNAKLDLFTQAEQLAVVSATMNDPIVKLMYDRLLGSAYLTYEDPETEQGLSLLASKGLLTPERKAEIVAEMQPR